MRRKLGPAVAPKEIAFAPSLPKTRSGKIMRRLLKARELGLPEGDTSTMEGDAPAANGVAHAAASPHVGSAPTDPESAAR